MLASELAVGFRTIKSDVQGCVRGGGLRVDGEGGRIEAGLSASVAGWGCVSAKPSPFRSMCTFTKGCDLFSA